jgi:hypothetical protein
MHLHHPTDNHPPTLLPLPLCDMANTSRDPFSLPPSSAPMKKKGGGQKKAAGVPAMAEAAASAGTPKKKTTSAKQKNNNPPELSDIEETPFDQLKGPPENIVPSLVPHTRQNAVRLTRNALPQPPAHVYILPVDGNDPLESTIEADVYLPPFDKDCNPLDHTSPHKHPPASFVEAAAHAASPADALEDDDEEEGGNLKDTFNNLVGEERSGLDDLSYSSAKDDEDYDDDMEEEARQIEYSDSNNVHHG